MASRNGTLIVRENVPITDAAGNTWTIRNGQVYENGQVDALTNRVIAIGYVNGQIVQENTDALWWAKTGNGWGGWGTPGYADGHIDNPLFTANRSGSASANLPGDNKTIVPQSARPLVDTAGNLWWIDGGRVVENGAVDWNTRGVIEMVAFDGKIYQENDQGLWWQKTYQGWGGWGTPGTPDGHTTAPPQSATVVNIDGSGTFDAKGSGQGVNDYIINMAPNATLTGSFTLASRYISSQDIAFNTTSNNVFYNTQSMVLFGSLDIPIPVAGAGTFYVATAGTIEFESSVGADQAVTLFANSYYSSHPALLIDKPMEFLGSVTLKSPDSLSNSPTPYFGTIDLEGLANADSYTFANDMLSIWSGQSVINALRLHDSTQFGFAVNKVPDGVSVVTNVDQTHPVGGLPVHTA